jgi:excisionase family DNA binding protein
MIRTSDSRTGSTQGRGTEAMDKLLLKPSEAAHVLGIGRTKLFELLASGALESVQIGHCRRVPRDAVDEFLTRLRAEQPRAGIDLVRGA